MAHRESEWADLHADDGADDDAEPTLCLFCATTTPTSAACWAHMTAAHGFDLSKLKRERKMAFYDVIRLINFLRATAHGDGKALTNAQIAALVAAPAAYADEKWLTPAQQGDALLFSLNADAADDDDDSDADDAKVAGAAAAAGPAGAAGAAPQSAAALARENARLKQQLEEQAAVIERLRAAYREASGLEDAAADAVDVKLNSAGGVQPHRAPPVDDSDDDEPLQSNAARPVSSGAAAAANAVAAGGDDLPPLEDNAAAAAPAAADVKGVKPVQQPAAQSAAPQVAAPKQPAAASAAAAPATAKPQQPAADSKAVSATASAASNAVVSTLKSKQQTVAAIDADYFGAYSDLYIHEIMLRDKVRTEAYRDFMYQNKEMFQGKVVLDIGCGSGILSLFAVRAGAKKVIGLDNADIIERAREVLKRNGVTSAQCELVRGKVEEIQHLPGGITEVDIIISEWMGYFLLFESMLPTVLYARDKWLKRAVPAPAKPAAAAAAAAADAKDAKAADAKALPAGTFAGGVYPNTATMYIAGMQTNEYQKTKIDWWRDVYGFDFQDLLTPADRLALQLSGGGGEGGKGSAGGMAGTGALASVEIIKGSQIMTTQCTIKSLDLLRVAEQQLEFTSPFSVAITDPHSPMTAFCVWFDNGFDHPLPGFAQSSVKPIVLDTSPHKTPTHWQQTVFYLSQPLVIPQDKRAAAKPNEWKVEGILDARRSVRNDREYTVTLRYSLVAPGAAPGPLQVQEYYIQ